MVASPTASPSKLMAAQLLLAKSAAQAKAKKQEVAAKAAGKAKSKSKENVSPVDGGRRVRSVLIL
jgi:hypothetical protein